MGHQVNYYLGPEDFRELEQRLRKIHPMAVIHSRSPSAVPRVVSSFEVEDGDALWLFFFLVREDDIDAVRLTEVPTQHYWSVDESRSPVIQFMRCFFDGKVLRRGRLYYNDGYWNADKVWTSKPEPFRKWARSVLAATRRMLQPMDGEYIGREARAWQESSGGKLEG